MNILVIDDSPLHRQSARQTLKDHNVTIVGTYDEAYELLTVTESTNRASICAEYERRHGPLQKEGRNGMTEEEQVTHMVRYQYIMAELSPPGCFDAVLSDLLMPASKRTMGYQGMTHVGQEMPVGFALVLMAARAKAKYAAVVTAMNHHDHPAVAMLDPFLSRCPHRHSHERALPLFVINGTRVGYFGAPMVGVNGTVCLNCNGYKCWPCQNSGKQQGKDWGLILKVMTTE